MEMREQHVERGRHIQQSRNSCSIVVDTKVALSVGSAIVSLLQIPDCVCVVRWDGVDMFSGGGWGIDCIHLLTSLFNIFNKY